MAGESQSGRMERIPKDDRETSFPRPAHTSATRTGLAWIHALALEWEAETSLIRYPQGVSEASLRK